MADRPLPQSRPAPAWDRGVPGIWRAGWSSVPIAIRTRAWLRTRPAYLCGCVLLLILAAILRWLLLLRYYLVPNSDQSIIGLMARHILAGEHPVFYWGQSYNGTLEAYLAAGAFRLFGASDLALHLPSIGFSFLFMGALMALAHRLYGRQVALLSGLAVALGPALLTEFGIWPGYQYVQVMGLGTLALVAALPPERPWPAMADGADGWIWRVPAAAFLLGLALWAQPLGAAYLLPVLSLLAGPAWHAWRQGGQRRGRLRRIGGLALGAALLALLPAIIYNLQNRADTLRFLASRHTQMALQDVLFRFFTRTIAVLPGLLPPTEDQAKFARLQHEHLLRYLLAYLLLGAALVSLVRRRHTLWRWLRSLPTARPRGEAALLLLLVTLLPAYLLSSWSNTQWSATEPRYLLPLYTLTPLAVRALWPPAASRRRRLLGGAVLAALVGNGLLANDAAQRFDDWRPLASSLQAQGVRAIYGDYWTVYRLAFASDEHLIPAVATDTLAQGQNRYLPYLRAANASRSFAWVVIAHSAQQHALQACLARHHAAYQRVPGGSLVVYEGMPPTARCFGRQSPAR